MIAAFDRLGTKMQAPNVESVNQFIERLRTTVGDKAFQKAWDEGSQLTSEEAIAYALGEINPFDD